MSEPSVFKEDIFCNRACVSMVNCVSLEPLSLQCHLICIAVPIHNVYG